MTSRASNINTSQTTFYGCRTKIWRTINAVISRISQPLDYGSLCNLTIFNLSAIRRIIIPRSVLKCMCTILRGQLGHLIVYCSPIKNHHKQRLSLWGLASCSSSVKCEDATPGVLIKFLNKSLLVFLAVLARRKTSIFSELSVVDANKIDYYQFGVNEVSISENFFSPSTCKARNSDID